MTDLNDVIAKLQKTGLQNFQWVSRSTEFDMSTPETYIEAWIKNTKESMALAAYALGRAMITKPVVLREQGGRGYGVRIRALTMPMLDDEE
jgi:hypothetical protein